MWLAEPDLDSADLRFISAVDGGGAGSGGTLTRPDIGCLPTRQALLGRKRQSTSLGACVYVCGGVGVEDGGGASVSRAPTDQRILIYTSLALVYVYTVLSTENNSILTYGKLTLYCVYCVQ